MGFLAALGMTFKMSVVVTSLKIDTGLNSASAHWLGLLCSIYSNREPILGCSRLIKRNQEISYPHILEEILKNKKKPWIIVHEVGKGLYLRQRATIRARVAASPEYATLSISQDDLTATEESPRMTFYRLDRMTHLS